MRHIKDCKVSVVGGAGFLGSHLVNYLIEERNCKVQVIDNLVAGKAEFINNKISEFVKLDISEKAREIHAAFWKFKPSFVFNYAAYPYIPDCYGDPLRVFNTNANGAINVINCAEQVGVEGILQISTAELYGSGRGIWPEQGNGLDEGTPVQPHSTYGSAKAAADFYVQSRWREQQVKCIALRQFNCVGERETHPYVIPEIISQLYRYGNKLKLGNNSSRDFMYAGDQVRYAVELLEKGNFGEVYNLGSEEVIQIYDLAQLISDIVGCGKVYIEEDENRKRKWEIWKLKSCNNKINSVVDYRNRVNLKEALIRTVDWFNYNGNKWPWEK